MSIFINQRSSQLYLSKFYIFPGHRTTKTLNTLPFFSFYCVWNINDDDDDDAIIHTHIYKLRIFIYLCELCQREFCVQIFIRCSSLHVFQSIQMSQSHFLLQCVDIFVIHLGEFPTAIKNIFIFFLLHHLILKCIY